MTTPTASGKSLAYNLPVLDSLIRDPDAKALAPLVHLEGETATPPDALRRLAVLGRVDARSLRLSRAQGRRLDLLRDMAEDGQGPAALGYRHGVEAARDALLLRAALLEQPFDAAALEEVADPAACRSGRRPG